MYGKELAECKKKKAEDETADVYMPVIRSDCTLGQSYNFLGGDKNVEVRRANPAHDS